VSIDFPGAEDTIAYGLNDVGDIIGWFTSATVHGFIWHKNTFRQWDLPGGQPTQPTRINNSHQVLGVYSKNSTTFGFLATPE
jgi:hypothetical protein